MRGRLRASIALLLLLLAAMACSRAPENPSEAERDKKFEEMMSGVTLVGQSTRPNREGVAGNEEYVIEKVSKLQGKVWLFQVRMKFGGKEIPVPIPIPIEWAEDTPVISMTDLAIPGMGTYTARVLLFRDNYVGMWSGKSGHGGHVLGKIVRNSAQ